MYNFKIRKNKNLEKLNIEELDAQEAVVTEGGTWWLDWLINVGSPSYDFGYTGSLGSDYLKA